MTATAGADIITYGGFTSSPNNDCTPPGGPTSLTLDGTQAEPQPSTPFHITFCLPRPEELGAGPVSLDDTRLIEVIDVNAELADGCFLVLDRSAPPSGTIELTGYCDGGLHESGYAISLAASVPGKRVCPGMPDESVTIELAGGAAVSLP